MQYWFQLTPKGLCQMRSKSSWTVHSCWICQRGCSRRTPVLTKNTIKINLSLTFKKSSKVFKAYIIAEFKYSDNLIQYTDNFCFRSKMLKCKGRAVCPIVQYFYTTLQLKIYWNEINRVKHSSGNKGLSLLESIHFINVGTDDETRSILIVRLLEELRTNKDQLNCTTSVYGGNEGVKYSPSAKYLWENGLIE